jgi:hypothetical protein
MDTEMNDIMEIGSDFEVDYIYSQYENGESVTTIAAEIGKSEAYVYAKMRRKPDKYEDVKVVREETRNIRVRRCSSLADRTVETYLEDLQDDREKAADNIDKVNRIGKEYANRVQLAEGKATERIGFDGKGGLPFEVVITKTYEKPKEETPDDTD